WAPASTAGCELTTSIGSHRPAPAKRPAPAYTVLLSRGCASLQCRLVRGGRVELLLRDGDRAEVVHRLVVRPGQAVAGRPDDHVVGGALGFQVEVEGAVDVVLVAGELVDVLVVAVPEVVPPAGDPEVEAERLVG